MTDPTWTNVSVLALLQGEDTDDPVSLIVSRTRQDVLEAIDDGWNGPPFDPVHFARMQGIPVVPNESVIDARTLAMPDGSTRIEFNPNRPKARVRFSIAHEIVHTLFPDYADQVRHRHSREEMKGDDWQLEMLCNVGAAEIVMPIGSIPSDGQGKPSIKMVLDLRDQLGASPEALVLRLVHLTQFPCLAFSASRIEQGPNTGRYRIDYSVPSRSWSHSTLSTGEILETDDVISECTAIGYTASGVSRFISDKAPLAAECVGVSPYPPATTVRSIGFLFDEKPAEPLLSYVIGNALEPRGTGIKILAHVVNDKAKTWGGRGVATAIRNRWPHVHEEFKDAAEKRDVKLGKTIPHQADQDLWILDMVAQAGYKNPKLRYGTLQLCLNQLRDFAIEIQASVHMPRIGTGAAGANWSVIEEQIETTLCEAGIAVTVYDLPRRSVTSKDKESQGQATLEF